MSQSSSTAVRAAWVMSRFPRLTETFVLYEILAVERLGVAVDVYPLIRERARIVHPDAEPLVRRARYLPIISWAILCSQIVWLVRSPGRYLGALGAVVRGTWGSANFLIGALGVFPKVAHAARLMQRDGVRHVHCHFANHPALAGFVIRRLTGIPYSFTAHGSDLYVDRHMLCEKVEHAAFVAVVSEYGRDVIRESCADTCHANVHVVHCGVDTNTFRPPAEPARPDGVFTILCAATLAPWKGQRQLIDACRILGRRGVPYRCVLVGGGEDREAIAALLGDPELSERVELHGWDTREAIAGLMREADVVVAPSVPARGKREGIPVTLMEAMATGTPVIASSIGGIPELVVDGDTGLLVDPGDVDGLAAALMRINDSPDLGRRLGTAGRAKVLEEFEIDANARRIVELISTAAPAAP